MSAEANRIYQELVKKLTDNNYLKVSEDGFYELTKTLTDMVKDIVEKVVHVYERADLLTPPCIVDEGHRQRIPHGHNACKHIEDISNVHTLAVTDFQAVKEYEAFEERV